MREHANILVLPVMNPDGYAYTFTADSSNPDPRGWRKNRLRSKETSNDDCIGQSCSFETH